MKPDAREVSVPLEPYWLPHLVFRGCFGLYTARQELFEPIPHVEKYEDCRLERSGNQVDLSFRAVDRDGFSIKKEASFVYSGGRWFPARYLLKGGSGSTRIEHRKDFQWDFSGHPQLVSATLSIVDPANTGIFEEGEAFQVKYEFTETKFAKPPLSEFDPKIVGVSFRGDGQNWTRWTYGLAILISIAALSWYYYRARERSRSLGNR